MKKQFLSSVKIKIGRILNTDSEYLSLRAALRWETVREAFKGNIKFKK